MGHTAGLEFKSVQIVLYGDVPSASKIKGKGRGKTGGTREQSRHTAQMLVQTVLFLHVGVGAWAQLGPVAPADRRPDPAGCPDLVEDEHGPGRVSDVPQPTSKRRGWIHHGGGVRVREPADLGTRNEKGTPLWGGGPEGQGRI